ncbi:MAG TPA: SusC/RagA family TonB-linked outer membrane protein, partial [Flavisolibacter sp.]|nr:SusC/RagA family TonB-linked outer membrane protein [Flavisolibacter sp.]
GNVLAALQGRVPGMFIAQNTGVTGSGFHVLIRGYGTFRSGFDPLYIVDGVPYPSSEIVTNHKAKFGVNGLSLLNTGEIERVEVLKDADATAIYGSRGGNGVVLITTKKATLGPTTIDLNLHTGIGKLTRRPSFLSAQQYLEMRREIKRNDNTSIGPGDYDLNGTWDTTHYTDWSKELMGGTAQITDGQLSISGGSNILNYRINGGYRRETTILPAEGSNQRSSVHFYLANAAAEKKLKLELSGTYGAGTDDQPSFPFGIGLYLLRPVQPPSFLPDGSLNEDPTFDNPYRVLRNPYKMNSSSLISHLKASWAPVNGLELSTSFGFHTQSFSDFSGEPASGNRVASANYSTHNIRTLIIEPQAVYQVNLKRKGKLSALVGATYQKTVTAFQNLKASGFNNTALLGDPRAATTLSIARSGYTTYKYLGTFSRLSYNLDNKYLLNATGRVDGTSRFGPGKQFHPFGAIGAAWIMSEERFMRKLNWINFAKLKASHGSVGNSDIQDYAFMDTYAPFLGIYQGVQGLTPNQLFDRNLGWELKKSWELALELQLFKNRLGMSVSTYRNRTSQQLEYQYLSTVTGFSRVLLNRNALVQNKGIEVVLSGTPVTRGHFLWHLDANVAFQQNRLLRFDGLENTRFRDNFSIGKPITSGMIYRFGGVDPQTGNFFFIDRNGHPTITPAVADRTVRIDMAPKAFGGMSSSLTYKRISLDVSSVFVIRRAYYPMFTYQRFTQVGLARWQKPGDITSVPKHTDKEFYLLDQTAGGNILAHPDASYLRVRNISLSYRLGQKLLDRMHMQTFRLYLQGQNLFTFSRIKNADPENIDYHGSIAPLRVITGGFQITF